MKLDGKMELRKLALYLPSLRGGGAERVMLTLANSMAQRGIAVDLILCKAEGVYLDRVDPAVEVIDLGASRVLTSLPALIGYIRREKPSAMISAMKHANVVAYIAATLSGIPLRLVATEHNTLTKNLARSGPKGAIMRALMRSTYTRCHQVVAVSRGVAKDLVRELGLTEGLVETIYNPIVSDELIARSREPLGEIAHIRPPLIVSAGRLTEQKDYPTLLRAFADLRRKKMASLIVLGTGPLAGELKKLAANLGIAPDVHFEGFRENPYAWMHNADLFVLSSAWEGLPTVLVEAMACGTRVVSTNCPSGPDEILENGKWGRLVPVGDHQAMAHAMLETLNDSNPPEVTRRAMEFSVDNAVDQYLRVIGTIP